MPWIDIIRAALTSIKELQVKAIVRISIGSKEDGILAVAVEVDCREEGK